MMTVPIRIRESLARLLLGLINSELVKLPMKMTECRFTEDNERSFYIIPRLN